MASPQGDLQVRGGSVFHPIFLFPFDFVRRARRGPLEESSKNKRNTRVCTYISFYIWRD